MKMPIAQRGAPAVRRLARELADQLRALLGEDLLEARLYGSWARGEATPDSDIDIVVIVQQANAERWQEVQRVAAQLSLAYDRVLSVALLSEEEWAELCRLQTLYARRLQEEGIPL